MTPVFPPPPLRSHGDSPGRRLPFPLLLRVVGIVGIVGVAGIVFLPTAIPAGEASAPAAGASATEGPGRQTALDDYDLDPEKATRWRLPGRLVEISGLATTADGRLLAHGDEEAVVYELDARDGGIVKRFRLSDGEGAVPGDFEGIATVDERVYLVTSAGRLYECREGADGESVLFTVHATGVGRECEVEGLAFDGARRDLLLLCKRARGAAPRGQVALHRWSVDDRRLRAEARTVIPVDDFARPLGEDEFRPSGIEWRAASDTTLVVAARPGAVAEVSADGAVLAVERLSGRWHRQAEGITLDPDGSLVVADEGAGRRARLTVYPVSGDRR